MESDFARTEKGDVKMSLIYVAENGAVVGVENNRLTIKYKDGLLRTIPIETVEGISILAKAQLSTACMETCMEKGIPVSFYSKGGRYFGRLMSTGHIHTELQRKQDSLYETDFSLGLARRIIDCKIYNQIVVLKRYARNDEKDVDAFVSNMQNSRKKLEMVDSIAELMGYEGIAARAYFEGLSMCIDQDFKFKGRSRRPPMDEFNSMISLGYSILMNEIYAELEMQGLNPYFGFVHKDAEKHPTLASDLIEEWRAVLIDSLVMSMINGHEVNKEDFILNMDEPGCFLTKECMKKYISKLEIKLNTKTKYLSYIDYQVTFRRAISLQIESLREAIETADYTKYSPIRIR